MPSIPIYNIFKALFFYLGLFFFFLMLVMPKVYQVERGVLLATLLIGGLVYVICEKWRLNKTILFWGFLTITASMIFIYIGVINNTPGALRVSTVYVLWPMVYIFFMGIVNRPERLFSFLKVIVVSAIVVSMMAIILVADGVFGLNLDMLSFFDMQGAGLGLYDGIIEYRLFNMSTAIYALPFLLGVLFIFPALPPFKGYWRTLAWIAVALSIVVLLISGRRAFILVALLSPFVVYGLLLMANIRVYVLKWMLVGSIVGVALMVVIIPIINLDFSLLWENFISAFNYENDTSSVSVRKGQFIALIDGWINAPILGAGHGAAAEGVVRNHSQAWAYELSYVALLFQTGLVGILVYSSAIVWIFIKGISVMRRIPESAGLLVPTLSGLFCFLIVNATNPYLGSFDYLWVIFLPVAILNAYILRGRC
jgi:hypothetical protein